MLDFRDEQVAVRLDDPFLGRWNRSKVVARSFSLGAEYSLDSRHSLLRLPVASLLARSIFPKHLYKEKHLLWMPENHA